MKSGLRTTVLATVTILLLGGTTTGNGASGICDNVDILRAVRIIDEACIKNFCDVEKLHELEFIKKSDLLRALSDPSLSPRHVFFPKGKTSLNEAFDWNTIKKTQLDSIADDTDPENSVLFIIGYASRTGSVETNIRLSRERMLSVYNYLVNVRHVRCKVIKGAWVGKSTLQLDGSDANLFNLYPRDYREDELVLNQAVHVFIYPCRDRI
jgi:outer membrane protein OmpA-like peptidoglycan-associated protein